MSHEKIAAWEAFYSNAVEEKEVMERTALEAVDEATKVRTRLQAAPAAKSIKVSMHLVGGAKPQTREWKKPTAEELSIEIPRIISRAMKNCAHASQVKIEQAPLPGALKRLWRKRLAAASSKVAFAMQMMANAKNERAVPMPPVVAGKPVSLPAASINENTSADPKHKAKLGEGA